MTLNINQIDMDNGDAIRAELANILFEGISGATPTTQQVDGEDTIYDINPIMSEVDITNEQQKLGVDNLLNIFQTIAIAINRLANSSSTNPAPPFPTKLPEVATAGSLPSASQHRGGMVYVISAGEPVFSNNTNWIGIVSGTVIA